MAAYFSVGANIPIYAYVWILFSEQELPPLLES